MLGATVSMLRRMEERVRSLPRTEDAEKILDDVERGLAGLARVDSSALDTDKSYARIADRRAAIAAAIAIAAPEDTVVLAGKGHEDYQIIGRERLPFSDRAAPQQRDRQAELVGLLQGLSPSSASPPSSSAVPPPSRSPRRK